MSKTSEDPIRVLVVDDDEFFRPTIDRFLNDHNFEAISAASASQAQDLLKSRDFDVVVSDINMPGMNGVELLGWIKANKPTPVILMTGFAAMAETLEAFSCGASAFLSKPFQIKDLLDAISNSTLALKPTETGSDDQYCKLALADFVSGSDIKYDIFVRLSPQKYVKIAHCGQDISVEQIKSYNSKGIHYLYLKKADFCAYIKFNINLSQAVTKSPKMTREKKLNFLKTTAELVTASIFTDTIDEESVNNAKAVITTTITLLLESDDTSNLLEAFASHADFIYAHSVAVSFYSVLVARKLGWKSPPNLFKLMAAGLFHDIGLKELPSELITKPIKKMTPEEKKLYETHPTIGAKILSQIKSLPPELAQVVLQHHENCVGLGYPQQINRSKIHPFSKVLLMVDEFCEQVLKNPYGDIVPPHEAISRMMTFKAEYYDPEVAVALMKLFNYPIPATLASGG